MPLLYHAEGSLSALEKSQLGILIAATQPQVIVETGVYQGLTTLFLSEFLRLNHINGVVYGFDLPEVIYNLQSQDSLLRETLNVRLVGGVLPNSLYNWLAKQDISIDLAIIDANHSFYAVYSELMLIGSHLSPNGYIFCHDYGREGTTFERVMCAVNEYSRHHNFGVIPVWSNPGASLETKCEAAILHRSVSSSTKFRLMAWRKYLAEAHPRLAGFWNLLRTVISSQDK